MATSKVTVAITGDASGLKKAAGEAEGHLGKVQTKVDSFGKDLLKGAAAGFSAGAVVSIAQQSVKLASDLNEASSKNAKIFGANAESIAKAGETAAQSMGLSKAAFAESAGTLGLLGQAAGLAGTDLSNFATTAAQRAADIGSFNNATTPEVIEAWGAAMRGEMEPMRRFGVALDDATLRQKALEMGLIGSVKNALTPQQKALAANALIMEKTSIAAGDYADTSDGLANSSKTLSAEVDNLKIEIGQGLAPAMKDAVSGASDLIAKLNDMTEPIGGLGTAVKAGIAGLGAAFKGQSPYLAGAKTAMQGAKDAADEAAVAQRKMGAETAYAGSEAERYVNSLLGMKAEVKANEQAILSAEEAAKLLEKQTKNLEQANKDAADAAKDHAAAMDELYNASTSLYMAEIDLQEATEKFNGTLIEAQTKANEATEARKRYKEGSEEIAKADLEAADALRTLQRDMVGVAEKAVKAAADKKAAAGGGELTLLERYQAQKAALADLETQYPAAKGAIDEYIKKALDPLIAKSGEVRDAISSDAAAAIAAWRNADGSITATADRISGERTAAAQSPAAPPMAPTGNFPASNASYGGESTVRVILETGSGLALVDPNRLGAALADALTAHTRTSGKGWLQNIGVKG